MSKSQRPTFMHNFDQLYDDCREMAEDHLLPNVNQGIFISTQLTVRLALMVREIKVNTHVRLQFIEDTQGKRGKRPITRLVNHTIDGIRSKRNQDVVQAHQNLIISTLEMMSLEDEGWPPLAAPTVSNAPALKDIEKYIDDHGGIASFQQPWLRKIQIVKDRERRAEELKVEQADRIVKLKRAEELGIRGDTDDDALARLREHEISERQKREQDERDRHWREYWLSGATDQAGAKHHDSDSPADGDDDDEGSEGGYGRGGEGPSRARTSRGRGRDGNDETPDPSDRSACLCAPAMQGGMATVEDGAWVIWSAERAAEARSRLRGD